MRSENTRILLVRHCEAMGNVNRIFQGHTDADISENGKKQLELLALRCRNMHIDAMYSSPLKRAYKTAEAINQFHHLPIHVVDDLIEINGGDWEGVPWKDFPIRFAEDNQLWTLEPHRFAPQNGEPMQHVYERMRNAVTKIAADNAGKVVCVASHGCAIRNFLCWAGGNPIEKINEVDWCDNTALSIIDFDGELCPHIVLQNDASHLSAEVSTFAKQDWWKK